MITVTSHHVQIERVVRRSEDATEAEFLLRGIWTCCKAWIRDGVPHIQARGTDMGPEQAIAVAISIQLAIEWISGQLAEP